MARQKTRQKAEKKARQKAKKKTEKKARKAAVLFSGGKDSCLALHIAKMNGYDIRYLLSIIPESKDALLYHTPDMKLLRKQADCLGVKLIIQRAKFGEKKELDGLRKLLVRVRGKVDVIIVGGIASSYQAKRFKKEIEKLRLKVYAPLWNFSAEKLWKKLLNEDFEVILTKIACEGLKKEHLGKIIDEKMFLELKKLSEKYRFRLDFEGGEAETAILFMPGFKNKKHIKIKFSIKSEGKYRHFLDILEVK